MQRKWLLYRNVLVTCGILGVCGFAFYMTWGDVTGADEINRWHDIPITNKNALFFIAMACIGGCVGWLGYRFVKGKKEE